MKKLGLGIILGITAILLMAYTYTIVPDKDIRFSGKVTVGDVVSDTVKTIGILNIDGGIIGDVVSGQDSFGTKILKDTVLIAGVSSTSKIAANPIWDGTNSPISPIAVKCTAGTLFVARAVADSISFTNYNYLGIK